jgi:predicted ATPase with chaperone activity
MTVVDSTEAVLEPQPPEEQERFVPPVPDSIEDTGLTVAQIGDLLLKILHQRGAMQGDALAEVIALPFTLIDDILLSAQQRHFVEVLQAFGHGRGGYTFSLTSEGRARAQAALEASRWVGPAPVPLEEFRRIVGLQSVKDMDVRREELEGAFSDLILPEGIMDALGPALNSGGSIFLHGAPGNGKTAIAERVGTLTSSTIYLPRAVMIQGSVMVLYDPVFHDEVEDDPAESPDDRSSILRDGSRFDQRFVKVRRPTVFVGGELTMGQLDLQYDPYSKVYQAPFQLKAAGGVLIIDDFGRQRMRPEELLNRWIVPLEKGFDNLTLHSGIKFPIPFDCILIFATNLNPQDLVDEAFLRRIQYKVEVRSPDRHALEQIFILNCSEFGVPFREEALDLLFAEYYEAKGFSPRGCHPRDIIKQIQAMASFRGDEPALEADALRRAAHSYFLVTEEKFTHGIPSLSNKNGV